MKGKILVVIGTDLNDQMLPIVFVVVEYEIKDSWSWFLELLRSDHGGVRLCMTYTFISEYKR